MKTTITTTETRPIMKITYSAKGDSGAFECNDGEPLLFAGLRHGVGLPYECATGTCGTCRARIADGDATTAWSDAPGHSYVKAERREVLMCQAVPDGDCAIKVPAKVQALPGHAPHWSSGEITAVQSLTHDVKAFTVAIEDAMDFDAGQFVVLYAPGLEGGRAYSMTNYAAKTTGLDFVVKRLPGGGFSDWLFDHDAGAELRLFGPLGRATFRPEEDRNVLCLGGGSGIAGMMSILSRAVAVDYFKSHTGAVFFGVRTAADVFFLDQLSAYATAYPDTLSVTIALSDEDTLTDIIGRYPGLDFATGFVHAVASERMAGRYDDVVAYIGGPPPMVDGALRMLILEARLPGSDVRYDKFG
jgi:toluene monooxygenase electron transfer component